MIDDRERQKRLDNTFRSFMNYIKSDDSLGKILLPEKYALPEGWAEAAANKLKKNSLNTNQLRKFLSELKNIDLATNKDNYNQQQKDRIFLLMPQIAYAYGRGIIKGDFYYLMSICLTPKKLNTYEDFKAFVNFYVSIVAYFKKQEVMRYDKENYF